MEDVNLKRTLPVTWEYVEVLNSFQWKTHSSKKLNVRRQLLDTRTVYQSYPLPSHRNGAEDPHCRVPA